MTKIREPLTPQAAIFRIVELIGWDGANDAIHKKNGAAQKYADSDTARQISFQDAIRLDLAFQNAGGIGHPLFEAYAARIAFDLVNNEQNDGHLVELVSGAVRECGEAFEASLLAIGNSRLKPRAIKEVNEALEKVIKLNHVLKGGV